MRDLPCLVSRAHRFRAAAALSTATILLGAPAHAAAPTREEITIVGARTSAHATTEIDARDHRDASPGSVADLVRGEIGV